MRACSMSMRSREVYHFLSEFKFSVYVCLKENFEILGKRKSAEMRKKINNNNISFTDVDKITLFKCINANSIVLR